MSRRFLQVFGLAALVGMFVASVGALLMVKEKFTITIAGDTAAKHDGPDPVALLRDDVGSLRRDQAALAQTLEKNFLALADSPTADGVDGKTLAAALAPVREALARHEAELKRQSVESRSGGEAAKREVLAALDGLRTRIEALAARETTAAAAPPPAEPPPPPVSPSPAPAPLPAPEAPVPTPTPTPTPPTPPAPAVVPAPNAPSPTAAGETPASTAAAAPAEKRKRFLSFNLPSKGFDFDKATRFEWIPSLSRVGFDAKSTLHDFSGTAADVEGSFTARLSHPEAGAKGNAKVLAVNLDTGIKERNQDMESSLEVTRFPTIEFVLSSFQTTQVDAKAMTVSGTAKGKLTLHGVTKDVTVPLRFSVDESRRVVVEGETPVRMSDYGVSVPTKMGVLSVSNDAKIWLALRARAVGSAE